LTNIPIVTAGGVVYSQHGPVIAILHQYAYVGCGQSIHSAGQLEWYHNEVNDQSTKVKGGLQRIKTLHGYIHPISIVNGLAYTKLRPFTDDEWDELPHVIWTGEHELDPHVLDCTLDNDDDCFDATPALIPIDKQFDEIGDYKTVVTGDTIPHAKLPKRHNALSFHRVREAMASRLMKMFHLPGECNPADIMSKHWGYHQVWSMLQAIIFYPGNTIDLVNED
jgi:hypothetical protein